ncbi:hypothetical protein BGZ63DRAFT_411237 [Mariannaea sp. PMI_226]|nr:hypothetical protein BGZ63DRAFT_411237 [Mariannaea sp. PMI_226]
MSIPPQLIRVKRKRVDETPVTFLQFDEGAKRHRTGSNWVYQRRHAGPKSPAEISARLERDAQPIIHVSTPDDDSKNNQHDAGHHALAGNSVPAMQATNPTDTSRLAEPRRFHISKKMMMSNGGAVSGSGPFKRTRYGPAVFVERSKAKATQRASRSLALRTPPSGHIDNATEPANMVVDPPVDERRLKKPTVKSRSRSPQDPSRRTPLPASFMQPHSQDMAKVAADMNDWVMREIGANLNDMEQERRSEKTRFKPKAPAKRYQERHPELEVSPAQTQQSSEVEIDTPMSDVSDMEDDDDWVIDEYVRIPAHAMTVNVAPTDVGVLVLDGEEDTNLFFGPDRDEDDELDEDDEDENAENYYTADYPEDEVESDDEYNRYAYGYRNANASDNEEYDNRNYDESDTDEMIIEGEDDDAAMARIKAYMKRSRAFQ